ncbi:hypothetical protein C6P40_000397 [Pichia californica]|uniref:NADH dehydrogenase [ubiquinone] 1 alpha subcomplex subunit n=1 Tax=Pichia californica TaxID=460514 RepID=A0A9P7BGK5_9ASCO|nr:hypothetical protein C6P42_003347 [[Candida] californica]KAG0688864.1 hypothetical protein C6P40_000397 [[Candida] californica]
MNSASDKLKAFYKKVPVWKQIYYKWRAIKSIPFRHKFFIGYDLDANTYWEFYLDKNQKKPRRMVQPYSPQSMLFNYFDKIPIQWSQWLKYARKTPPSIFDIINDEERIKKLQIMANYRDSEQLYNKELKQAKIDYNLEKELHKLQDNKATNAAKIVQRSGYDLKDLQHKEIKHSSNAKLQTDASMMKDNDNLQSPSTSSNDPWADAAKSSDQPTKAAVKPVKR